MTFTAAKSESARLSAGTPIVFETAGVLFFARILQATKDDRLLVTVQEATDPRFAARLPKRLWIANATSRLRDQSLRIAGAKRRPVPLSWQLAA